MDTIWGYDRYTGSSFRSRNRHGFRYMVWQWFGYTSELWLQYGGYDFPPRRWIPRSGSLCCGPPRGNIRVLSRVPIRVCIGFGYDFPPQRSSLRSRGPEVCETMLKSVLETVMKSYWKPYRHHFSSHFFWMRLSSPPCRNVSKSYQHPISRNVECASRINELFRLSYPDPEKTRI